MAGLGDWANFIIFGVFFSKIRAIFFLVFKSVHLTLTTNTLYLLENFLKNYPPPKKKKIYPVTESRLGRRTKFLFVFIQIIIR